MTGVQTCALPIYGPGGTGKTFLYNTLCDRLRPEGKIVLFVASPGIAAQLLPGERTAHKRFKIPIPINDTSTCRITWNGQTAELLRAADLLMGRNPHDPPTCFRCCGPNLAGPSIHFYRELTNPLVDFPVICGGDFQQILPVIPLGGRDEIVAVSIQHSAVWPSLAFACWRRPLKIRSSESGLPKCRMTPARLVAFQSPQWFGDPSISRSSSSNESIQQRSCSSPSRIPTSSTVAPS